MIRFDLRGSFRFPVKKKIGRPSRNTTTLGKRQTGGALQANSFLGDNVGRREKDRHFFA